jgi:thymidylate synthase
MATIDREFSELCKKILNEGKEYENKNRGVKRLQIPSYTFRHEFKDGFPAITNKKLYWKGIVGELIWFLRGDNDVKFLNDNGIKIWNKDAYNWHKKTADPVLSEEEFYKLGSGSVGQNYSVQWRNFNGKTDQIKQLFDDMKKDIMSSRMKVNAWNPCEVDMTALPPCHSEFQIIGVPLDNDEFGFELHWNQRSVDTFLGLPFNIASYGLLAKILEQITGFKALAIEGTLKCVHFYDNQYDAARELVSRNPDTHLNCEVTLPTIDLPVTDIDKVFNNYKVSDFKLVGYTSDEEIKVDMLAPKE